MNSTAEILSLNETLNALAERTVALEAETASSKDTIKQLLVDLDTLWLFLGGVLVFFMQGGFALVEAGSVRIGNTKNILLKNVMDACIGALVWWAVGFSLAYGDDGAAPNPFIGGRNFFLQDEKMTSGPSFWAFWLFQWSFSATAATVVSGGVAERCQFGAYIIYTCVLTALVYPVVVHWGWSSEGWLSAFRSPPILGGNGLIDFGGAGIVHMCGGCVSLMGSYFIGPRSGRFNSDGSINEMQGHSTVLATTGTLFLWFGWYGFNSVSTIKFYGMLSTASRAAVTTTLAGASAGCTALAISFHKHHHADIGPVLNAILGGLVGITSTCAVVDTRDALIIGVFSGFIYYYFAAGMKRLQIDDPLEASAVHLACGAWGVLAGGLFPNKANTCAAGYQGCTSRYGFFYGGGVAQLGVQLLAILAIGTWSLASSGLLFFTLNRLGRLRVSKRDEEQGLDISHHGGSAYAFEHVPTPIGGTPVETPVETSIETLLEPPLEESSTSNAPPRQAW